LLATGESDGGRGNSLRRTIRRHGRLIERLVAVVGPLSLLLLLTVFLAPSLSPGRVSVVSGYVQSDLPGIYLPAVYFLVNYTGLGAAHLYYTVTYNSTSDGPQVQSADILVSAASHFTYYLFLSWPDRGVIAIHIQVCQGQLQPRCAQIFASTLYLRSSQGHAG
jgi:hypothetical protein